MIRILSESACAEIVCGRDQGQVDVAAKKIVDHGRHALVRHVQHLDAGALFEQHEADVRDAPDAGRSVAKLARIGLGIRDEVGTVLTFSLLLTTSVNDVSENSQMNVKSSGTL